MSGRQRRNDLQHPKVLIPAYGCPDLVAAVLYAGAVPLLVDLERDGPGLDLDGIERVWDEEVIAVVAVNFLGIREQLPFIQGRAHELRTLVIEDSAQWYPEDKLTTEAIVLSFGRGKPVNVLGGGALLLHRRGRTRIPPIDGLARPLALRMRAAAFNLLIRRRPYAWASRLPLMGIGRTRFRPLAAIHSLDDRRIGRLSHSARTRLSECRWRERLLDENLSGVPGVLCLPTVLRLRRGRLLRYPLLLAERSTRDRVLRSLIARGLGASAFYERPLCEISGMPAVVRRQGDCPAARSFAERLLTLPIHQSVTREQLEEIVKVVRQCAGS
jgi:dTDP-4-amino-4,6-dideoxygalactose transaminase